MRGVTVPSLIVIDLWLGSSIKEQTAIVYAIESSEGVSLGKDFFRIRYPACNEDESEGARLTYFYTGFKRTWL